MRYVASLMLVMPLAIVGPVHGQEQTATTVAVYRIDAESSSIRLLIYRAGALSRLGHNHVILADRLQGSVYVQPALERSTVELEIPVDALVVDDPAARGQAGEEFSSVPSARDVQRTRENMLGERVLDAERFAVIRLTGRGPSGEEPQPMLDVSVELIGREIELSVPVTLRIDTDRVEASGAFRLSHEKLGLPPFSVMGGALKVADEMDVSYWIVARRAAE